jgi:trk system potassium uptake protein TrkH
MHWRAITQIFGILLLIYSIGFLPSIGVSLLYHDGQWQTFVISLTVTAAMGIALWLPNIRLRSELSVRDGFLVVTLFWFVLGIIGSLPFILGLHLNVTDAIFESVSGFTTAGATVILGLDKLPASILYHRQQIQWLGGMGIIVLAVAILPLLGVGGMQLYRAEASGISQQEKITPRIAETARSLWMTYLALTLICASLYWLAGMSSFDAVGHAFSTIATGGFSTHDSSIGYFHSPIIEIIATIFMLFSGINFAVHFLAWKHKSLQTYVNDPEVKAYGIIFLVATLLVAVSLAVASSYAVSFDSLRHAIFQVASVLTSTGFGTATFADWPLHIPLVLAALSFTGGCVGSTAGGIKVLRMLLLAKVGSRELFQLSHPRAVTVIKLGGKAVPDNVLFSIWGFYVLYIITSLVLTVAMMAAGLDLESAFGAVMATLNLLGPGLGEVATNFSTVTPVVKWLSTFAMLVGRLEVFTLLILLYPPFWKR